MVLVVSGRSAFDHIANGVAATQRYLGVYDMARLQRCFGMQRRAASSPRRSWTSASKMNGMVQEGEGKIETETDIDEIGLSSGLILNGPNRKDSVTGLFSAANVSTNLRVEALVHIP